MNTTQRCLFRQENIFLYQAHRFVYDEMASDSEMPPVASEELSNQHEAETTEGEQQESVEGIDQKGVDQLMQAGDDPTALADALENLLKDAKTAMAGKGESATEEGYSQLITILDKLGVDQATKGNILTQYKNAYYSDKEKLNQEHEDDIKKELKDQYEQSVETEYNQKIDEVDKKIDTKNQEIKSLDAQITLAENQVTRAEGDRESAADEAVDLAEDFGLEVDDYESLSSLSDAYIMEKFENHALQNINADAGTTRTESSSFQENAKKEAAEIAESRLAKLKDKMAAVQAADESIAKAHAEVDRLGALKLTAERELTGLEKTKDDFNNKKDEALSQVEAGTYVTKEGNSINEAAKTRAAKEFSEDEADAFVSPIENAVKEKARDIFNGMEKDIQNEIDNINDQIKQKADTYNSKIEEARTNVSRIKEQIGIKGVPFERAEGKLREIVTEKLQDVDALALAQLPDESIDQTIARVTGNYLKMYTNANAKYQLALSERDNDPDLIALRNKRTALQSKKIDAVRAGERFE